MEELGREDVMGDPTSPSVPPEERRGKEGDAGVLGDLGLAGVSPLRMLDQEAGTPSALEGMFSLADNDAPSGPLLGGSGAQLTAEVERRLLVTDPRPS